MGSNVENETTNKKNHAKSNVEILVCVNRGACECIFMRIKLNEIINCIIHIAY